MKRFNDSVVQSRIDKRYLATATRWYVKENNLPMTISELIRYIVEDFVHVLVNNGKIEFIEESENARQLLEELYRSRVLNPSRRGIRNEYSNLLLDDVERNPRIVSKSPGHGKVNDSLLASIRRGLQAEPIDIEAAKQRELSQLCYDDDGLVINKVIEPKIERPEDWGKVKVQSINKEERERLMNEAIEQIRKKYEVEGQPIEIQDRKDSCTIRKFSSEEIRKKEELDRKKLEEQNRLMNDFDPRTMAIKESEI
jgi:hypothetical protein